MAPPATAADTLPVMSAPRDSQINIDIMAHTKGVQWPYFLALLLAVLGVLQAVAVRRFVGPILTTRAP